LSIPSRVTGFLSSLANSRRRADNWLFRKYFD
jgi:hypothetical protein